MTLSHGLEAQAFKRPGNRTTVLAVAVWHHVRTMEFRGTLAGGFKNPDGHVAPPASRFVHPALVAIYSQLLFTLT